jgi:replicative DNA helicase
MLPLSRCASSTGGVEGRDNKRPSLGDLRDSGSLEQDASLVVFTYRPAYYFEQRQDDPEKERTRLEMLAETKHRLELSVSKNRNGRVGTVDAFCDIGANAIRNASYVR